MIAKLKRRPRPDSHRTETRVQRRAWDRAIYLVLLAGFALLLLDYALGDRVVLRADGLVLRDRSMIAATSTVRVTDIRVRPGQRVAAGDVLLRAESTSVLDRLADLAVRGAELDRRRAALAREMRVADRLLPIARDRLTRLDAAADRLEGPAREGLITATQREEVDTRRDEARMEFGRLAAISAGLEEEIAAVSRASGMAHAAVTRLRSHYDEGLQRAPRAGIIDEVIPSAGQVFSPGEPIAAVLSGSQYVLAYLPRVYLFDLKPGQAVRVAAGKTTVAGTIEAILPVSASVPDEFHNSFRARERRQLARISIPDGVFPTRSTVRIRSDGRIAAWLDRRGSEPPGSPETPS
ncbi:HlyD family secretion protein [Jannaschia ovalis]|uniref:HlyD family efflux transporter periplasmic adaptor subunit n=1 Tax=Jannaschia ovalis TaxID=3038773 RepID=A0ABY8LAT1_9RHOB|nr:HlyD family efflux transporter periplasmic adaptor subunit [Jannaschia sp. GRR-S6-38]WGH78442.1 HlyD family efflux transporter periplasmic adaptor subunit [Jannaschia sp. GRR-S6-38]